METAKRAAAVNRVNLAGNRVSSGRLFGPAFSNTGRRGPLSLAGSWLHLVRNPADFVEEIRWRGCTETPCFCQRTVEVKPRLCSF